MLTIPHGSDCRCEDCLGVRITRTAAVATVGRTILPLRARQLRFEARLADSQRSRSPLALETSRSRTA
jgi:hypothetical protein